MKTKRIIALIATSPIWIVISFIILLIDITSYGLTGKWDNSRKCYFFYEQPKEVGCEQ